MPMNANTEPFSDEPTKALAGALTRAAAECRDRPETRAELDADPRAFFAARGAELPAGTDCRVVANSPEVFHLVMPPNPNVAVADETLSGVAGGTSQLPACTSSVGCIPSTLSTASSIAPA